MSSRPKYRCFTKATKSESGAPRRSQNWVASRRSRLTVFDDKITCGDWTIPVDHLQSATLYWFWQVGIPGQVLELNTGAETYQFGINPWCRIGRALPFPVVRKSVWLRMSTYSWVVRIVALGAIVYWVWKRVI